MLYAFGRHHDRLVPIDLGAADAIAPPIWIDLCDPSDADRQLVNERFAVDLPDRAEMDEIEPSSRLYSDGVAEVMTVTVAAANAQGGSKAPVTFALTPAVLITVRYADPTPFGNFVHRPLEAGEGANPEAIMIGLLEAIVDRAADMLEQIGGLIDSVSREVFARNGSADAKARDLEAILERIGSEGDMLTKVRESLVGLNRLLSFHGARTNGGKHARDARIRVKTVQRDVLSLTDHAGFLSSKINFLLDATLGLINLEQNQIIKIFTVASVAFLPPTLIASIYGMNFDIMPELHWHGGYLLAIGLMILSALLPFLLFRKRGWL